MIVQDHICILLGTISCFIKGFIDGNGFSYYDCQDKRKEMQTMEELIAMLEKLTVEQEEKFIAYLIDLKESAKLQRPSCNQNQEANQEAR